MIVVGCLLLGGMGLWMLISPRSVYWKAGAWQHRNPAANEPSDLAYGFGRVVGAAMVILSIVGIVVVATRPSDAEREDEAEQEQQQEREQEEQGREDLHAAAEALDAQIREATAGGPLRDSPAVAAAAEGEGLAVILDEDFPETGLVEIDGDAFGLPTDKACLTLPAAPAEESRIEISSLCLAIVIPGLPAVTP